MLNRPCLSGEIIIFSRPKRCRRDGFWRCSGRKLDLFLNLATWNCLALGETEADREWKLDFCRQNQSLSR